MKRTIYLMVMVVLSSSSIVLGQSNIDPDHKFSWNENIGWMNWRDADATNLGVFVNSGFLSGFIWFENGGWMKMGNGVGPYGNTSGTDFGVNILPNGDLDGFAWCESMGWVNFGWAAGTDLPERARLDLLAKRFRGWGWMENGGWINLDDGTTFVGVSDVCSASDMPIAELLALPGAPLNIKNRALSIEPGNAGANSAIRVTYDNLPAPFNVLNSQSMWAGAPIEYCENSGQTTPPVGGCGPAPGAPRLTFFASELQCSPFYTDWSGFSDVVHIFGEFIVPNGTYSIQLIHEACDIATAANFSAALQLTTSIWGDSIKDCTTSPCGPPDGSVDIVTDVTAGLDKFKNVITGPSSARVDLEPKVIDQLINISDVTFILNAFSSDPYPFAPSISIACP